MIKIFDIHTKEFVLLDQKTYIKYLGRLIDSNLTWKYHISYITSKISKTIGVIARLRHFVPSSTLLTLYRSLVSPYLLYGLTVWGQAPQIYLNQILVLQKRALRLIYFAPYRSSAVPLFVSSGCLPIGLLYFKAVEILMHDVHNNLSPRNISNLFSSASVIHTYNTRFSSDGNLYTKYSRLAHQIKSFSRRGVLIWNSIPPDLRKLSKPCFKNKMQHYLLQILNQEEDYVGIPTIMSHLQKLYSQVHSLYSIHYRLKI